MYCNQCRKDVPGENGFCVYCGEKLVDAPPAPEPAAPPAADAKAAPVPASASDGSAETGAGSGSPKTRSSLSVILITAGITALVLLIVFIIYRDTWDPRIAGDSSKNEDPGIVLLSPTPPPATVPPVTTPAPPAPTPAATPAPTPAATPTPTPVLPTPISGAEYDPPLAPPPSDDPGALLASHPNVTKPKDSSWLTKYKTKYVQSTGGYSIYLWYRPSTGSSRIGEIRERDTVTVVAEQGNFSLVVCSDHRIGWCATSLIVTRAELIAPIPSLTGRSWTLYTASGRSSRCIVTFYPDRTCELYYPDLGRRVSSKYTLEGRRLKFKERQFLWYGEYFKSRAEIDFANEKAYYYLREYNPK